MSTAKKAEAFVRSYFERQGIRLAPAEKGIGYNFRSERDNLYVDVKGASAKTIAKIPFRYFTAKEFEKARSCHNEGTRYEIHLIADIDAPQPKHYVIPGDELLVRGKAEVLWSFPLRKDDERFSV